MKDAEVNQQRENGFEYSKEVGESGARDGSSNEEMSATRQRDQLKKYVEESKGRKGGVNILTIGACAFRVLGLVLTSNPNNYPGACLMNTFTSPGTSSHSADTNTAVL
jgi:hypothetical protein